MDNNKMFIFMIIFAVVMIATLWIFRLFNKEDQLTIVTTTSTVAEVIDDTASTTVTDSTNPADDSGKGRFQLISPVQSGSTVNMVYENSNIRVVFDTEDALVKNAWIKDTFLKNSTQMYDIVQGESIMMDDTASRDKIENRDTGDGAYRIKFGSWDSDITLASLTGGNARYHVMRTGNKFTFTARIKNRLSGTVYTIEKIFQFIDKTNFYTLDIKIYNDANEPLKFDSSGLAWSVGWGPTLGIDSRKENGDIRGQENYFVYFDESKVLMDDFKKITAKTKEVKKTLFANIPREGDNKWVGASGHYFASLMNPNSNNQAFNYFFDFRDEENKNVYCGLTRSGNNSQHDSQLQMYFGPKIRGFINKQGDFIEDYDIDLKESSFAEIEKVHMFGIGNMIGHLLRVIYRGIPNYGLTIIILTLIIKLILFPLTYKSMQSQQNMSKLQPKLKELQEKYKEKPEILNRETMALYKKEGINPLGGCLPMILQMPILIAMYRLLSGMVELKGAGFLWISDLSQPDAVLALPFTIPLANISTLNIMPILMVGVQVLSSLMMPSTSTNKQAQMMMWMMPLMFFFLFYNMPSGLVVYWTVMNLLNLVQQAGMKYLKDGKWKTLIPGRA
jgi:YidC/Oxa1 family membrane protein insertase